MVAGEADKPPFGFGLGVNNGFLGLIDARGNPHWIYRVDSKLDTTSPEACYYASHYSSAVYGICNVKSEYFQDILKVPIIIKLDYKTGILLYTKYLPLD